VDDIASETTNNAPGDMPEFPVEKLIVGDVLFTRAPNPPGSDVWWHTDARNWLWVVARFSTNTTANWLVMVTDCVNAIVENLTTGIDKEGCGMLCYGTLYNVDMQDRDAVMKLTAEIIGHDDWPRWVKIQHRVESTVAAAS